MWSALVEEDGGGISVDAMLVANALVHRTIHRSKVHRAPYQCARLNKNTVCHVNTFMENSTKVSHYRADTFRQRFNPRISELRVRMFYLMAMVLARKFKQFFLFEFSKFPFFVFLSFRAKLSLLCVQAISFTGT
jgi:hypothetical protein